MKFRKDQSHFYTKIVMNKTQFIITVPKPLADKYNLKKGGYVTWIPVLESDTKVHACIHFNDEEENKQIDQV